MSNSNDNISSVFVMFFLGVGAFFWGFMRLRRKRLIENIPTSTVRGLAMGLVELSGIAKRDKLLRSPLTYTECVMYRYLIERYRSSGKSGSWVTVAQGGSLSLPFVLSDDTGSIPVFPKGSELILPVDFEFTTGWGKSLPANLENFLVSNSIRHRGFLGSSRMRFKEWYIRPEEKVYVLGVAKKTRESHAKDYTQELAQRIRQFKDDPEKMKEVDLNKDGEISQEEWHIAVSSIEKQLLEEEAKSIQGQDVADVVIAKGDTEKTFIISDYSQKELVQKLAWQAMLGIWGGMVLSLIMLAILLSYFNVF